MSASKNFTPAEMAHRLDRIRSLMSSLGLDALVTRDTANIRYATGFKGEPGTLLITPDSLILWTSFRTLPWAEEQTAILGSSIQLSTQPSPLDDLSQFVPSTESQIGVDSNTSSSALSTWRQTLAPHNLIPTTVIEQSRQIKSAAEIAIMQESQQINEAIFNAILPKIQPGMTERGIQGLILSEMATREEVDRYSFTPIVAAGPNCWEIHHLPDQTITRPGDLLIIDLGIIYRGYASDMTRSVCLGKATTEMNDIHHIVNSARQSAIDALKPGITNHEVDRIARDIITDAGHGRTFTHGLGHSIGLETHDPGLNLSPQSPETKLRKGMVLTIEPGIYLENKFGIRIEDTVVVTANAPGNLTVQSTDIVELQ